MTRVLQPCGCLVALASSEKNTYNIFFKINKFFWFSYKTFLIKHQKPISYNIYQSVYFLNKGVFVLLQQNYE